MTLDTSNDTIAELKRQAEHLEKRAAEVAEDDPNCEAKFLMIRGTVLQALLRVQRDKEALGDTSTAPPEVLESNAINYLTSRGWKVTPP